MSETNKPAELTQAAYELQRYLSDEIAPMMAAEIIEELVPHPPELTARIIAQWIQSQDQSGGSVADLVFHALKKIYLVAEFELVARERMLSTIQGVSRILLQACPAGERDALRMRLSRLGEETVLAARAEFLHREIGTEPAGVAAGASAAAPAQPPKAATLDRGARALSLLLEQLAKIRFPEGQKSKDTPEAALLAQVLSTAALESKTQDELTQHLEKIRSQGIATPMGEVFRALGWSLPGWTAKGAEGETVPESTGRPLEAMNRIVALAPDAQERAKRWGEMIYAAIEQFNEGRLAQAVSILEAAKRLIAEKHPDPSIIGQVLAHAEGAISEPLLKRLVESPAKHGLLRKVLEFFPSLRVQGLLLSLDGEIRRERRKLYLALLECHGPGCRDAVLTRLVAVLKGEIRDEEGFYRRNLAFLLRRIPRSGHERIEEELELLESMIERGQPGISAKEAAGALGQLRLPAAERALADRLRELESEVTLGKAGDESWELLDRLCAGLARQGTQRAIRVISSHAFKRTPALGDTMARFEHLGTLDLMSDPEQLVLLLKVMRELMPSRMLGRLVRRSTHEIACLVRAVAGTSGPEVRSVLEEVQAKLKGTPVAEQAAKALERLTPRARAAAAPEALTGDLELFGLPYLLQSLAGSESTGELTLFDKDQVTQGALALHRGKIARIEAGRLKGLDAGYLLMEKPTAGSFSFRATPAEGAQPPKVAIDPMELILEGARRHDEYKAARALAPDRARFEPAGISALRPEDEDDGDFASNVWDRAAAGTTPLDCEAEMEVDPFRVRRLYAAWVEALALRPRTELATA